MFKTPLRYPGGKSRATTKLSADFPKGFTEYREPFLGGGSVALSVTTSNLRPIDVWVNDAYYNLYNFWVQLRDRGQDLQDELISIKQPIQYVAKPLRKNKIHKSQWDKSILDNIDKHRDLFNKAKSEIHSVDNFTKAVYFWILNKCSFSGLGESSSFSEQASEQNFSLNGMNKLIHYTKAIKDWKITNLDYADVMNAPGSDNCFVFLDPPYNIKDNLYGKNGDMHSGFDHMRFYEDVTHCPHNWMITYNSNETLKKRFSDYYFNDWDLTYTMQSSKVYSESQKDRKELLITNYERNNNDRS